MRPARNSIWGDRPQLSQRGIFAPVKSEGRPLITDPKLTDRAEAVFRESRVLEQAAYHTLDMQQATDGFRKLQLLRLMLPRATRRVDWDEVQSCFTFAERSSGLNPSSG